MFVLPKFDSEQKYLKFMFEIMILVSSANNIDSDIEIILRRRSYIYIYIMNNRGPRIYPWGNSMFQCTPVREKFLVVLGDFTSISSTGPEPIFRYHSSSTEM